MTRTAQDHDTLAELIREGRRTLFAGPRSALREILVELAAYGTVDSLDALRALRAGIDAANEARSAWARGDELEAQALETRVWVLAEILEDLAGDLEDEGTTR